MRCPTTSADAVEGEKVRDILYRAIDVKNEY